MTLAENLQLAASVFEEADGHVVVKGAWVDVLNDLYLADFVEEVRRPTFRAVHRAFRRAQDDLWNIKTLLLRLAWQRELTAAGQLNRFRAASFAEADINSFHVEMRSAFDHIAYGVATTATKKNQVPDESFRALRKFAVDSPERASALLGDDVARAIGACDWFVDLREVRDDLVHRGGRILVFPDDDRTLFQCYVGFAGRVQMPEVMFNENVANFDLYSGTLIGQMLALLERLGSGTRARLNVPRWGEGDGRMLHDGNRFVLDAINRVRAISSKSAG